MNKVFLIVPRAKGWHLELGAIWQLYLDLLGLPFFVLINRWDVRDWQPNGRSALLAFCVLQAFGRGLEA